MHSHTSEAMNAAPSSTTRGLLVVMMDIPAEYEAEFNDWYDNAHLPALLSVPGVLSARRYVARQGAPKYLLLLELETAFVLDSPAYQAIRNAPQDETMRRHMHHLTRTVYDLYQFHAGPKE